MDQDCTECNFEDQATAYAEAVVAGEIVAGPHVRNACRRHLQDIDATRRQLVLPDGEDWPDRGLVWDAEASERVIGFFRDVLTVDVEEQDDHGAVESRAVPFILLPWQAFIVGSLFGWKRSNGLRRFRRGYIEAAKGSGKSPILAGIGHYMLVATGKLKAEVYSAATDRDQAMILFRDAVSMWERSPHLRRRLIPSGKNPTWQLTDLRRGSFFKPISSDKRGKSGIRPYCALIDEIHEHPDNSVIEMLRAGTKGNQEALVVEITNSGFDRKSVCWLEHSYSVQVAAGELENDQWFSFVCGVDQSDDPMVDESCWIKANPSLGITIQREYIAEQVREAQGMPSKEAWVRRLQFCQWTESETAAFERSALEKCFKPLDLERLTADYPCFGGLDLSRANDLTALTLAWLLDPTPDAWRFAAKTWFWTPRATIHQRSKADRTPYDRWAKAGFLEAVDGKRISYLWIANALNEICSRYQPRVIGADQYGLENMRDHMIQEGISLPIVVHPQGFRVRKVGENELFADTGADDVTLWMPASIDRLEAAIIDERLDLDDNPVMKSCMSSVVFEKNRTGHRMFVKDTGGSRIDGAVSLAMAIGVATVGKRTDKVVDFTTLIV